MIKPKLPICQVATDAALRDAAAHWRGADLLALDTEFIRVDTFYPVPALLQISDGKINWLIDACAPLDWAPVKALLLDDSVCKVMHSCSEDLEVLDRLLGVIPTQLIDTQLAAAMTGYGFSRGYASLVSDLLDISVPKDATRSNWLARPLSEAQLRYAALDVELLVPVARQLLAALSEHGRAQWINEDYARLAQTYSESLSAPAHTRIKGLSRLSPRARAAIEPLAAWRDRIAREQNLPRRRVAPDAALIAMAKGLPERIGGLAVIDDLPKRTLKQHGNALLALLAEAKSLPSQQLPDIDHLWVMPDKTRCSELRAALTGISAREGFAPEILARRHDIEALALAIDEGASAELDDHLQVGWRAPFIREALLTQMRHLS